MMSSHKRRFALASLGLVALLAACGGGESADTAPKTTLSGLRVMGDSLADVGTFGFKFTVQGGDIYPERVAQTYGLNKGCNVFAATYGANNAVTGFTLNTAQTGCTNYAVGGGVINPVSSNLTAGDPRSLAIQLTTATAAGNYGAAELLLVDGGGNDAAALVGAYLAANTDAGASFRGLSSSLLGTVSADPATFPATGVSYMTALANKFYDLLKANALDKGAQRVALLNMPGITNTPRFQTVLDSIAAATKAGALAGGADEATATAAAAKARSDSETLFKGWVTAFNTQLASKFAGDSRVVVIDFYTEFNNQIANPTQFGLTNVKTPACPATGVGSDGLPTYSFPTCTAKYLADHPQGGASTGTDWYNTWAFSDSFHPTPYGHQLLSQLIARSLAQAGWL